MQINTDAVCVGRGSSVEGLCEIAKGEGLPFERLGNINQTCTEHLRGINKVSVIAVDCSNELDLAIVQSVWVEVHCGLGKTRWEEKQTAVQVFEHIKSLFICEGIANGKNNRIRPVTIGKTFDLRDGICPACIDYSADTKAPCALELFGYQFRDNNPCAI